MRISDWSSDVCSSDLTTLVGVRNDQVWMNTGEVQPYSTSMMNMADAMAATALNAADRKRHDSNWSATALVRYAPSDQATLELGYARKSRSPRSEEHTSELQSQMRISYGDFCLKK